MDYTQFLSIFIAWLIIFSLAAHPSSSSDGPTQALIDKICSQTSDYPFCYNTFRQKLLPTLRADAKLLTQIAITQSLEDSTTTRIYIQKKESAQKDKETRDLYEICNAGYGFMMEALEDATRDFVARNYKNVINLVSKCERPINDCQRVFGANIDAGLKEMNRKMGILVTMSLAAARLIGT